MKKYCTNFAAAMLTAVKVIILGCIYLTSPARAQVPIYRVGFNYHLAPFQFIYLDGSYRGLHIDIMHCLEENYKVQWEFYPYGSDTECEQALSEGTIDVILGINSNYPIQTQVQKVERLSSGSLCTIAPAGIAQELRSSGNYRNLRASFVYRTINYAYLRELGATSFVAYGNHDMLYQALRDGTAPLAVGLKEHLTYLLQQDGLTNDFDILHSYVASIDFCLMVRSTDTRLYQILSDGLASLRTSGTYETLHERWIIDPELKRTQENFQRLILVSGAALLLILIVFAAIIWVNHSLKKMVERKTFEITKVNQQLNSRLQQISSESMLRNNIIRYSPNSIVVFDQHFRITLLNEPAERLFRVSSGEVIGRDARELQIIGGILEKEPAAALFALSNPQSEPKEFQTDESEKQIYRYSICSMVNENSELSTLVSIEDITYERKKLYEQFEVRKNQQLNKMAAGIAHEIKNPLMALKTATSLIIENHDDQDILDAFQRFVPNEIDRINNLVNSFINYARPATAKTSSIYVPELLENCLGLAHISAKKSKIQFSIETQPLYITASRDQIRQSIINIMMNGIDAIEQKQQKMGHQADNMKIEICAYPQGDSAVISIRDSGIGMTQEQCEQCIEPYFTTKLAGTGLGLSIVNRFVADNGGVMAIESKEGEYTEVILRFRRETR